MWQQVQPYTRMVASRKSGLWSTPRRHARQLASARSWRRAATLTSSRAPPSALRQLRARYGIMMFQQAARNASLTVLDRSIAITTRQLPRACRCRTGGDRRLPRRMRIGSSGRSSSVLMRVATSPRLSSGYGLRIRLRTQEPHDAGVAVGNGICRKPPSRSRTGINPYAGRADRVSSLEAGQAESHTSSADTASMPTPHSPCVGSGRADHRRIDLDQVEEIVSIADPRPNAPSSGRGEPRQIVDRRFRGVDIASCTSLSGAFSKIPAVICP